MTGRRRIFARAVVAMKWGLTLAAIVTLVAGVLSWWWRAEASYCDQGRELFECTVTNGGVWLSRNDLNQSLYLPGFDVDVARFNRQHTFGLVWWFRWWQSINGACLVIPLWLLFIVAAVPAGLLWVRDCRRSPLVCRRCGYSRAGLAPEVACPECGHSRPSLPECFS